jgi:hypothetical protein
MTGAADETGAVGGDLGVGGPAEETGAGDGSTQPEGYPEEVDPAQGPVAGGAGDAARGDLEEPGAP